MYFIETEEFIRLRFLKQQNKIKVAKACCKGNRGFNTQWCMNFVFRFCSLTIVYITEIKK